MATQLPKTSAPAPRERYQDGWRAGKPIEDPEKTKRWGFITANPSEYLICLRGGKIDARRSGQGATVFKWPWQSVAIVPTSLQQVDFKADQVTREKVGVEISGVAVYRIVNPQLAFRVLNFSFTERASEKLSHTMREMFIGASRRLIANLSIDECLTRRKETISDFLIQEIAPVVSGKGAKDDETDQGWGVVIDSIEIQDVVILSEKVFKDMQAPFRATLSTQAEKAELDRQREVAERRAETERRVAEASIQGQRDTRVLKAVAESEAAETEAREVLKAAETQNVVQKRKQELEQAEALLRIERDRERQFQLLAAQKEQELRKLKAEQEKALALVQAEQEQKLARLQAEQARALAQAQAEETRRSIEARTELAALQAEATLRAEQETQARLALKQKLTREKLELEGRLALQALEHQHTLRRRQEALAMQEQEQQLILAELRVKAELEARLAAGRALQTLVSTGLPEMARVLQGNLGPISFTHLGGQTPLPELSTLISQGMVLYRNIVQGLEQQGRELNRPAPLGETGPASTESAS